MGKIVLRYEFNNDGSVKSVTTKQNDSKQRVSKKMQKEALKEASAQLVNVFGNKLPKLKFK